MLGWPRCQSLRFVEEPRGEGALAPSAVCHPLEPLYEVVVQQFGVFKVQNLAICDHPDAATPPIQAEKMQCLKCFTFLDATKSATLGICGALELKCSACGVRQIVSRAAFSKTN